MRTLVGGVLLAMVPLAGAEPLYVIEQLTIGISTGPDETGEPLATVRGGDRVEVLETAGDHARIRLDGGQEGWLRSAYLSAAPPLRRQLAERTRELERVRSEIGALERSLADARAEAERAREDARSSAPAAAALAPARPLLPAQPVRDMRPGWLWVAVGCTLALAAGFALGWRVLDRRIRRKYGGLRIY